MNEKLVPETIDEYISLYPLDIQLILKAVRQTVKKTAPNAGEKIAWGMPSFYQDGGYVAQFAAQKKHLGFYPGPQTIVEFQEELAGYKTTPGGIQFPYEKPVPHELIQKMVQFRVLENKKALMEKEAKKKMKK
ncbi:iron chaperone [Methanolapillus ohkumae]|uniref:YdhG-like domain-containing protein n=1 Tax=Methanolapillus ohkumae TaxID=3028298 RepID=A0AA96ZVX7_9EURY|nr:hypothetical protein MsAm2_11750 [Methanosarcinaceae archaeon Am2]